MCLIPRLRTLVFLVSASALAAEPPSASSLEPRLRALGPAPRLFASAADWTALPARLKTDPVAAAIYAATKKRADALLAGPILEHKQEGTRRLASARLFQGRILDLATVARVEKDPRYADRAREELLAVAALPDWGPGHFLDVAEYALGVAVGLDWLHDSLPPDDRNHLAKLLVERAIQPTFDGSAPSLAWLGGKSNWTQVCHAGLTAAALAVADREPALAARTIARAIKEQALPNAAYAPDGVYPEGPMYWAYGTTFEVILISLLEHSFGTDFGLAATPGFLASADYLAQVTAPSGDYFNYADARLFVPPRPVLHWFAAKRRQPALAAPELDRRSLPPDADAELLPIYERNDALALWWHRPDPKATAATPLPLAWLGRGENPVAVFRSALNDPRATFIGFKGGSPSTSHAHMDAGSFVLEAEGVRWAVDPGMQDYHSLESAGVNLWDGKQTGARWGIFRLGPAAHNILRFDAGHQRVDAAATFTKFDAKTASATLDLTPIYAPAAKSVTRRARLLPDRSVLIEDTWTTGAKAAGVTFQWLTLAEVEPTADGALLRQDGKTLRLRVTSPEKWTLAVEDTARDLASADQPNPGLRRLVIRVPAKAGERGSLRVQAIPGSTNQP